MTYAVRLYAAVLFLCCGAAPALAAPSPKPPAPPTPLPRPFGRGHAYFHPTAVAPYRFKDTIVRVSFDFARGIVYGHETAIVAAKRAGLRTLPFNTLGIHYTAIAVNGRPARYRLDAAKQQVRVRLPAPAAAGQTVRVDFTYSARPQRGIYFIRPDKGYPHVAPEIWSQGEMIDNRRWFPTWDEPNQKTPSELIVTVPHGWTVVANGYLKSHADNGKTATWDWNAPKPKSTYLIAFAAGPLFEYRSALGKLPVDAYVQPRYAKLDKLCFGVTKDIVAYDQSLFHVPFPWEKEDQVTAERFTYGGMENASVTIQTARAIHPAGENLETPCDGLVAHELAHQWWGDDVTMADWANVWINEGYATYFQELWSEKRFGESEFEFERYNAQQAYFRETKRYWRPIVDYVYNDPLDVFDASGYPRPGQVLHMLRYMFGSERFFKALHDYLIDYQYKNANTHQFFAAIDKSLGTNLTWFENEWFYRASYPHYYVTQRYDPAASTLTLDVRQKNHDGKPFRMPVVIEVYSGGSVKRVRPLIDRNRQVVKITGIDRPPVMVLFDPDDNLLRKLTFDKNVTALAYQAVEAKHVGDRLWALAQLRRVNGRARGAARSTIAQMAYFDPFYGVRADAVGAAGREGDWQTVRGAMSDRDPRVVIAAIDAAAHVPHAARTPLVARLVHFSADPNALVASAALSSLGAIKAPGAYALLVRALGRPSWREQVASGAVRGLGALGDARAMPLLEARTAYGTPEQERDAAVSALAALAVALGHPQSVEPRLAALAQRDPLISTRVAAVNALGTLGLTSAIPVLQHIEARDPQQAVSGSAWNAILSIRDAANMRAYQARLKAFRAAHHNLKRKRAKG